jgi:glutamyl-tRNA synthetase
VTERVRFSPAPTGRLHLGGARTALFNWLVARRGRGVFVVRVEDTDIGRSERRFEASILEDLGWLGLDQDEGPEIGGPHGPYRQSERHELYLAALERLRVSGHAYPCFCEPDTLAADREADAAAGRAPRYAGRCRALPAEQAAERVAAGEAAAWRFRVDPDEGEIAFEDAVHGRIAVDAASIGDFMLMRSDGRAVYDLACVVDDAAMAITTVIRGDDHIPNTPRQLLLYDALGITPPRFAHLPLVTAEDGAPLSKSAGAMPVAELRAHGYLPSAVINHLALLGWSDPVGREMLTREELTEAFELARVAPAPAGHDQARLRWLNSKHLRALGHPELVAAVAPFLPPLPPWLDRGVLVEALRDELETAEDAAALAAPVVEPLDPDAEARAALAAPAASRALALAREVLARDSHEGEQTFRELKAMLAEAGLPPREALPAVRAALTGRAHGLPIGVLFELLGPSEARRRVDSAATGKS